MCRSFHSRRWRPEPLPMLKELLYLDWRLLSWGNFPPANSFLLPLMSLRQIQGLSEQHPRRVRLIFESKFNRFHYTYIILINIPVKRCKKFMRRVARGKGMSQPGWRKFAYLHAAKRMAILQVLGEVNEELPTANWRRVSANAISEQTLKKIRNKSSREQFKIWNSEKKYPSKIRKEIKRMWNSLSKEEKGYFKLTFRYWVMKI